MNNKVWTMDISVIVLLLAIASNRGYSRYHSSSGEKWRIKDSVLNNLKNEVLI
jgi:hypothetical protein